MRSDIKSLPPSAHRSGTGCSLQSIINLVHPWGPRSLRRHRGRRDIPGRSAKWAARCHAGVLLLSKPMKYSDYREFIAMNAASSERIFLQDSRRGTFLSPPAVRYTDDIERGALLRRHFLRNKYYSTLLRKSCSRGSLGLSNSSAGLPSSRIFALGHEHYRSATSRAKPISWVTTAMVMPSSGQVPHRVQHLAHHLRVQCAGGLVKEHHLGSIARGPHNGDPLLLSAGEHIGDTRLPCPPSRCAPAAHSLLLGLLRGLFLQRQVPW